MSNSAPNNMFKKATKNQSKLRMAICGPSGSGKTYTSLALATYLSPNNKIAVLDTERGSAAKYADIFQFDVMEMASPYHPDKFIAVIAAAKNLGYEVLIIDSISHAWAGTGGVLDIVDETAKRSKSGNSYMAWKSGTPIQNKLIDAIVQSGMHIIVTMRSKTEYILTENGAGKQAPKKVGMAPVQRDQFEYEFDILLEMDIENNAIVSKTRLPSINGKVFSKPGEEVGNLLKEWCVSGKEEENIPLEISPSEVKENEIVSVELKNYWITKIEEVLTKDALTKMWKELPSNLKQDEEIKDKFIFKAKELEPNSGEIK